MRWTVTGAAGLLGTDVVQVLRAAGEDTRALGRGACDVTDAASVARAVAGSDVVVNCAGWTAVDDAEAREGDAFAVNAAGAAHVARAAAVAGARLVHVSTDYVFSGRPDAAGGPWPEDAPLSPRSAYGRTKAAGEWAVRAGCPGALVVRTAWLYGEHGRCFPATIARLAAERGAVRVVDDQVGPPTWTRDVAAVLLALVRAGAPAGTYHATSAGQVSWHGFARAVLAAAGIDPAVLGATTTAEFARPAPRPAFSVLGHAGLRAAGVAPVGDWRQRWAEAAPAVLGAPGIPGPAAGAAQPAADASRSSSSSR